MYSGATRMWRTQIMPGRNIYAASGMVTANALTQPNIILTRFRGKVPFHECRDES
jgi:hypothetical protein